MYLKTIFDMIYMVDVKKIKKNQGSLHNTTI